MAEGDLAAAEPARTLTQSEIDSLLGDDLGGNGQSSSGIRAIVESGIVSYERLPMLEVVFDSLSRLLTTSLRNFTYDSVEVTLDDDIRAIRCGDYLNSVPLPAMISVIKCASWDNYALLTVDSSLIYSMVDVLLGGRRGTVAMRVEGRPYTTIERKLIERMAQVILADLAQAFAPVCDVEFAFERIETDPRFAAIARPQNAALLVKLRIEMEERGGKIELLLPYATLEPVREILLQGFLGEKFGRDSIWESHLSHELLATDVELEAVLDTVTLPLGETMNWQVGTQIMLNATPASPVRLVCGQQDMFEGNMGRKGGRIAIRVDRSINGNDK